MEHTVSSNNGSQKEHPTVVPYMNGSKTENAVSSGSKTELPANIESRREHPLPSASADPPKARLMEKYFDSNIEVDERESGGKSAAEKKEAGAAGGYRDSWKARNDQQNTVVFNFVNSKKDVSHIENDGLDLSNRIAGNKKVGFKSMANFFPFCFLRA